MGVELGGAVSGRNWLRDPPWRSCWGREETGYAPPAPKMGFLWIKMSRR